MCLHVPLCSFLPAFLLLAPQLGVAPPSSLPVSLCIFNMLLKRAPCPGSLPCSSHTELPRFLPHLVRLRCALPILLLATLPHPLELACGQCLLQAVFQDFARLMQGLSSRFWEHPTLVMLTGAICPGS